MSKEMVMRTSDFLKGDIPEEIVSAIANSKRCIKTTVTIKVVENFGDLTYPDAFIDDKGDSCLSREVLSCYKVDHLAFEKLCKHDVYLGKRKKRGLFQSSIGKLINADINGAIGIGRKVFGDSYVSRIIDSGLAFNPVRVNIL